MLCVMGNPNSSLKACARVFAILTLLVLSGLAQALAYEENTRGAGVVAEAGTTPMDHLAPGSDFSECALPAAGQSLYCNHVCCNVLASGPISSVDDDQPDLTAQPGAPVPRGIEVLRIASLTDVSIPAPARFLLFRNLRE
jgi:hypothetical protein